MTPTRALLEPSESEGLLIANLEALSTAASAHEVLHRFKRAVQLMGFDGFAVYAMPPASTTRLLPHLMISSWSSDFIKQFDDMKLTAVAPHLEHMQRSTLPYVWHADHLAPLPEGAEESFQAILREYGIATGMALSIHDPLGNRYIVNIDGHRDIATPDEVAVLQLISSYAVNGLYGVMSAEMRSMPSLTNRELECLEWTAAGKTSGEIAAILTLSEHTVSHYIAEASRKLDCVSRTQAVAKAFRLRLIK